MTQSRDEPKPTAKPVSLPMGIAQAAFATAASQPCRQWLNQAGINSGVKQTLIKSMPILYSGFPLNLLRGSFSSGVQTYTKENVNHILLDVPPTLRIFPVLTATAMAGMSVALLAETPFIRWGEMQRIKKNGGVVNAKLWRFTPALPPLYLARELGFSVVVFYATEMSFVPWLGLTAMGAGLTGAVHKFLAQEATRDLIPPQKTIPDFAKDGFRKTIRNIAAGGVYKHEAMKSLFDTPQKDFSRQALNLMYSACGYNMFIFRSLYLLAFGGALKLAKDHGDTVVSQLGLFAKKYADSTSRMLQDEEVEDCFSKFDRFQ